MNRTARGVTSYHAGLSAEGIVANDYARRGHTLACTRWRGQAGEIDLIFRTESGLVFVEVKKSRSFDRAAHSLGRSQIDRIMQSAEEFAATEPAGSLTEMRFDVALVDGSGALRIVENAFSGL